LGLKWQLKIYDQLVSLKLKSDHFGIEIYADLGMEDDYALLKSDHFGIEIVYCIISKVGHVRLKSDHFGIEMR